MLPSKRVALLIAGLFLLQGAGSVLATNHEPYPPSPGQDIVVSAIDGVTDRVVGVSKDLVLTIKNQGDTTFRAPTGWQIFVGFGSSTRGLGDSYCIEPGDGRQVDASNKAADCYQRFGPTADESTIPAGSSIEVPIPWNASRDQGTRGIGDTWIHTEITTFDPSYEPGSSEPQDKCPDDHCDNNVDKFNVFVEVAGVRAIPLRVAPDVQGATPYTPWPRNQIVEVCPVAPTAITRGCKTPSGVTLATEFRVTNTGNAPDTFRASFVDVERFVARQWKFSVTPSVVTLSPDEWQVVTVHVVIPKEEGWDTDFNVNSVDSALRWTSTKNPRASTDDTTGPTCDLEGVVCMDPPLPSVLLDKRFALNATSNETIKQVFVRQPAKFNITLNNTGNVEDRYTIAFDRENWNINDSWVPTVINPGEVKAQNATNATIQVRPPTNATMGRYYFEVFVQSLGDPDLPIKRFNFTADLQQSYSLSGAPGAEARVLAGEPVTFGITVSNNGNGEDTVTLELEESVFGWNPRLSNRTLVIPPFTTLPVTLTVTAPPNTGRDIVGYFNVTARSEGPPLTGFDQRVQTGKMVNEVTVLRGPNVRLTTPTNSSFVDAGSSTTYEVLVRNVGNEPDGFNIALDPQHPDWSVTVEPERLVLEPLQQQKATVTLRAPAAAAVGETSRVFVTVTADDDPRATEQTSLEGRVSGPDLYVESVVLNATNPYSGDPLEISVGYGNRGNRAPTENVTLGLYFVQGGIETLIEERVLRPQELPGQLRTGTRFQWDTSGQDGAGVLVARIDGDDHVLEIDDSTSSNEVTRAVTLRTFDIRLVPAEGLSGLPGERVSYSESPHAFLLEYRGNQPTEPVTVRIESEHGWLQSEGEMQLALPRGTVIPIHATVDIPEFAGTAEDVLRVSVIPSLRPDSIVSASTRTRLVDEAVPIVRSVRATPAQVELDEEVTIEAVVVDATGLASVQAFLSTPSNETQSIPLAPQGDDVWSASHRFQAAGRYRVSIEAVDASEHANRNFTRTVVAEFLVVPGTAPTIELVEGQSTRIRTGSIVAFDIRDPLGIAKATYSIMGIEYDLPKPDFRMDTSSLRAGAVEVTVRAENLYGVASTARFRFDVDNTEPTISNVEMTPKEPKANEDVTLRIRTDDEVSAVEVTLKRDGQLAETLTATRVSAGTFELTFNPGQGDYSVDVTAKDAAGNERLSEEAVVFSARPGSPFDLPAPGVIPTAFAVLAAALLALRRRRD